MGARDFGLLVDQRLRELERQGRPIRQHTLAVAIGVLPDGTTWDATRVRRLREGRQVRLEPEVVARIIDLLDLDPPEAWHKAGLAPPWLSEEDYRASYAAATQAVGTNRKKGPGEDVTAGPRLVLVASAA